MPSVMEVLVTLTHDDYQQVATLAQQGLVRRLYADEDQASNQSS